MNIIILKETDRIADGLFQLSDHRLTHIREILKSKENDVLEIGLLNGPIGHGKIISIDENNIVIEISELINRNEKLNIDLICALPRPQTLKKILNLCGTMEVNNLYFIRSEKVEKSYFHSPLLNEENYTKYLIEGLSQGKTTRLPKIFFYKRFKGFFNGRFREGSNRKDLFVAEQRADHFLGKDDISGAKSVTIAIGPEGGWNEFELNFMKERGFKPIRLSSSTLRVENAVNAILSQIELLINL